VLYSLAFGNEYGVAVVDIVQKVCLLNIGTPDLYGTHHLFIMQTFSSKCFLWPFVFGAVANLKGPYFQPNLSVCVCLCVSDRHFYPSTLTDFDETEVHLVNSTGGLCDRQTWLKIRALQICKRAKN